MPIFQRSVLPEPASIIVLNGTSSAGKTSLSKALQALSATPLQHVQLNAFRDMEPPDHWANWEARGQQATDLMLDALCSAMHATVRAYATHGQGVIFDTVITNPRTRQLLAEDLADLPVHLIAVKCDPPELTRREAARGDRDMGLAARQFDWIHQKMPYDFEVDTTAKTPEAVAAEIVQWMASAPAPSAIQRLRAQLAAA